MNDYFWAAAWIASLVLTFTIGRLLGPELDRRRQADTFEDDYDDFAGL